MNRAKGRDTVTLFLGGDVMTGRGIDQVLPHAGDPAIHEPYVSDARDYVTLAEGKSGPIALPVGFDYIWGEALGVLDAILPDVRIVNLETSVTTSNEPWPGKAIHYRMHPANIPCLTAAGIDFCALANNHVLDWSRPGLVETLATVDNAGIACAGAGCCLAEAVRPAVMNVGESRLLLYSVALPDSGIPRGWAAEDRLSGIHVLPSNSRRSVDRLVGSIRSQKQSGDVVLVSIHWGGNWGYDVPTAHRDLARTLVKAGVDVVHGHSSHHAMGIEVVDEHPVLYGCGDLINDYEGINKERRRYRGDLRLLYFVDLDANSGRLRSLRMAPMRAKKLRLQRASIGEAEWLRDMFVRHGEPFGTSARLDTDGFIELTWPRPETAL